MSWGTDSGEAVGVLPSSSPTFRERWLVGTGRNVRVVEQARGGLTVVREELAAERLQTTTRNFSVVASMPKCQQPLLNPIYVK